MKPRARIVAAIVLAALALPQAAPAETYVIPFADIRQEIDASNGDPDAVIRAYLAGLIRDELDAQGFNVDGGLVFGEIPLDEITERIANHCYVPSPYKVHTDATTATVSIDDSSSVTIGLDSIRTIDVLFDLNGLFQTSADAWVRWGQDVPFIGSCKTISTDNGWVSLYQPFAIDLAVALDLDPTYDAQQVAIVVDKHAAVSGTAQFYGGDFDHDFGAASPTDLVLSVFEDQLLDELGGKASAAIDDEILRLNYRLDGLDENGVPDPTLEAFNAPSTFLLSTDPDDQSFIRDLLAELGVPEVVLAMVDERGVEILLQLVILEGAERDAYLASLGAEVGCEALLGSYQVALDEVPLYTLAAQGCELADLAAGSAGGYFADAACADEVAFSPTDELAYCQSYFGPGAASLLGNAAGWVPDTNQPGDELPGTASRRWTLVPTSEIDLGVVSLAGNSQPYMKQLNYRTVTGTGRGTGTCELEMRVYKRDIAEQGLRPLLALHGGTWAHRGSSFMGLEAGLSQLTERGFIVFAPFYRLVGDSDGNVECNGASWREVTADVESALDWVNQNGAAFGALQEPVSVFGQSAGAHLSAWLAANRSAEIRKALLYYGPTDALEFLDGAVPPGGPFEAYRSFGLRALERLFGAYSDTSDINLAQINFAGLTAALLDSDWQTLLPDTVFDLSLIDTLLPPVYVARCAAATQTNLAAINLALPPADLMSCMKQELRDFLVRNSFNHQLGGEAVPVFVVQGSGDTIVPHEQAVSLCGAIDGSVLPTDIVDPLTVYACGTSSEVQVARDADHALDLGVCLEPLCPAGEPGSVTRDAVHAAISASYAWLQQDVEPDFDGDGIADTLDPDDDNDGISDEWELANGLDPFDAADAFLDDDVDGANNLDEFLAGTDPGNPDTDGDSALDGFDNCPATWNADQFDADRDGTGNRCDAVNNKAPNDFNGDGRSDILWQNQDTGEIRLWLLDGGNIQSSERVTTVSDLNWHIVGTGDYDGDGNSDILLRNAATGQNWMYLMDGASIVASAAVNTLSNLDWQLHANGDLDGDGRDDILLRNAATGQNWLYTMNGQQIESSSSINVVPIVWQIAGTGDYNGDGTADILWRHQSSGRNWMYLMNGAQVSTSTGVNTVSNLAWTVVGSGDSNGDGNADILWRNVATGQNHLYLMNGAVVGSSIGINTVSNLDWQIAGTGDYDSSGSADLFWRNAANGQNLEYLMDGAAILESVGVAQEPDSAWTIVSSY